MDEQGLQKCEADLMIQESMEEWLLEDAIDPTFMACPGFALQRMQVLI